MSNVSIYGKNWIDLVFEDRNKAYGAYQLRQENPRTTLIAFFSGVLFLFSLIGLWLFFSSFDKKPFEKPIDDRGIVIKLSDFNPPKSEKSKTSETQSTAAAEPNKSKKLVVA